MDWSEEGIDEEESTLRRRTARPRSPPGGRPLPPPRSPGSRSPSPHRGGLAASSGLRSPSPRRVTIMATRMGSSVRTIRRSPTPRRSGADAPASDGVDGTGVKEIIAKMREGFPTLESWDGADTGDSGPGGGEGGGADEEEPQVDQSSVAFSFQELVAPLVVDGAEVIDAFVGSDEARTGKAAAELLDATMGANTGPRTEAIKTELLVNRRLLDLAGLERWMRTVEAVSELEWFTGLCCDENSPPPHIDLFECAFRALENASDVELHHGADARKRWIGPVGVPEFFICPISNKVMENPVVIASGKTVDRSALEKWQKKNGRICPVTGELVPYTMFIPNVFIKLCIEHWRAENKIACVTTAATNPPHISNELQVLIGQATLMPHSPGSSKEVRKSLFLLHKVLADKESAVVHLIGCRPGTIAKLVTVLPETCLDPDPELEDVILRILEKAASYGPNKAVFGDDQYALPVLIARTLLGPAPMRARCARILGLLADDHYNKIKIGELGGFAPLVELLYVGDKGAKKTAAKVIGSLCEAQENQSKFLKEGVVDAAISALRSDGLVEEAQDILLRISGSSVAFGEAYLKLESIKDDDLCQKTSVLLWKTFVLMNGEDKHDAGCSMTASKSAWGESSSTSSDAAMSSTSSDSSADERALRKQNWEDAKIIASWLQKRCSFPNTYRYRED
ncbi:U-box domain-containing protein 9 [Zea mays]|uniref:RING-type E3 ubiquitin transferase n=2 Tax=Zea mays TaxID=4577 RepID=K7UHK0_MAIZE|nr:U-box domain-containing protein 12 isoform X1 [Zea mays]AQK43112.1 Putative ARM repeat-containing protein containing family protein [Zea mays]PWZ46140.1 U-box domain-containing protein 9 [Zea mays]|eukprot:XP_008663124.1 U-box domain-containing protein 12 isoform X1 [Zea mays]